MAETIVETSHLTHAYGQRVALSDISLGVAQGEIFGFLGPNGSGKTTLFRILSTLLPSPPGAVKMLGIDLASNRDEIRRHIGVVFQSPSLDKQLTPEENLRHHGHLYGLRGRELAERIDLLLARVGLSDRRHERVEGFSGGMRRRVELAKGMLNKPRILLLDEPSTGLDPTARIDLWNYLKEIQSSDGVTILLTTHLMDEADRCSRLAILNRGQLAACDTPLAMKDRIGGDVIRLVTTKPQEVADIIRQKFNLVPEILDQIVRLELPHGPEFIPPLMVALPGLVDSVSVGKPTLEDVFIHLTGRVFRDEPQTPIIKRRSGGG
ncbi:MAG: ATP-binding cassette domain-containing protein [Planctomycetota bacterium]|nr:ATP-binding cassette domain-containing protein [Planctomycetota bacterium]